MGVPVITLVGEAFHQRISYSALVQVGLEKDCAAFDEAEFVARAVAVANDPEWLRRVRHGLRDVVAQSPLCDEERFVYQFQEMLELLAAHHKLR
jgi:predicted O-linked N-acetylglucosamine transferase (SPINDLY family)